MTRSAEPSPERTTIQIEDDGRLVAAADIQPPDDDGVARSALHVESGQLPGGTRTRLVDAVLDSPQVGQAARRREGLVSRSSVTD